MDSTPVSLVSEAAPYVYETLDHLSDQIRIFTLLPSEEKGSQLRGTLRIVSLPPKPPGGRQLEQYRPNPALPRYEALSYVWGDQIKQSSVLIGDEELPISENLSHALRRLRQASQPRDLWIDAICICQSSSDEKSHQVGRMFTIYWRSSRVLIWLGEADDDSDYSMTHLEDVLNGAKDIDWTRVRNIFHRTWWRRVWTLQEALAANLYSLVLCGEKKVPWLTALRVIEYIAQVKDAWLYAWVISPDLWQFATTRNRHDYHAKHTLAELVFASSSRAANDPRDSIFALLGLLKDDVNYFDPDYSKSVDWTYQMATTSMLKSDRGLNFLIFTVNNHKRSDLLLNGIPSWCLDFSRSSNFFLRNYLNAFSHILGNIFGATYGRVNPSIEHDPEHGTLTLRGTVVGRITETLLINVDALTLHDHKNYCLSDLFAPTRLAQEVWEGRLGSVITENKIEGGDVYKTLLHARVLKGLTSLKPRSVDEYKILAESTNNSFNLTAANRTPELHTKPLMEVREMLQTLEVLEGKTLTVFATDTGYMAALGDSSIPSDSFVCILFGCRFPIILRQGKDETCKIIGFAYVDGIMNGEFLKDPTKYEEVDLMIS